MTKEEKYIDLYTQIKGLLEDEVDEIANMANASAAIHNAFQFWWTGFYIVKNNELVLGPFQGPVACTRIAFNKGVCGTAWAKADTLVVPDVHQFEGHIACSAESNSEIVVPLIKNETVYGVLDIDSRDYNTFDETDAKYLQKICELLN
ncbi:MAG: GAF domain-containing protein [Bacteroidetes bacterium]|nr:GAF domain-containing protein [Bacteroidota bacterium]